MFKFESGKILSSAVLSTALVGLGIWSASSAGATQERPKVVNPGTVTAQRPGQGKLGQAKIGQGPSIRANVDPNVARRICVDLNTFELFIKNDKFKPGGDEPYLYVRTYWIDGTTVKLDQLSQATFRREGRFPLHGNLGRNEVREYDAFVIPSRLGHFESDLIPIAPVAGYPNGLPAQIIVAVAACEKDLFAEDSARLAWEDVFKKFDREVEGAIRTLTPARASQLGDSIKNTFKKRFNAGFRIVNLAGVADPDDVVGTSVLVLDVPSILKAGPKGIGFLMNFEGKFFGGGGFYYVGGNVRLKVPPPVRRDVEVTITQVKEVDDLESLGRGDPDFQARVGIGGQTFNSPEKNGSTIRPNWVFRAPAKSPSVPISIELFERDAGSFDEHCDINPQKFRKSLLLSYDVATGMVSADKRGPGLPELVSRGREDSDKAEIAFTVRTIVGAGG